jgi:O-antigen ligase
LSVVVTLAYFRRRELLRLAPFGLVVGIVVSVLSPGAIHGVIAQFTRSDRGTVATTSDRTADYDAIRPDLWTHVLFGRGFGSYNHETYRILDSEILSRAVETGVLGLVAFLLIGFSVIFAARRTIADRDPTYSRLALIGTAVAVCFMVVATLYDVLSFPHATYIFLYMAGLVTVVVGRRPEHPGPRPPALEHAGPDRRVSPDGPARVARRPAAGVR